MGTEAGEGLVAWFVAGDRAGSGPGRVWVAPGTACGRRGGGQFLLERRVLGDTGSLRAFCDPPTSPQMSLLEEDVQECRVPWGCAAVPSTEEGDWEGTLPACCSTGYSVAGLCHGRPLQ